MTKQLLFYELVTPISHSRHADWSVAPISDYRFAAATNSVPLTIPEFLLAAQEYPIVFTFTGEQAMPTALLGFDADKGVFIDGAGSWNARYIPAFVRRYPFVFSTSDDGQTFTLCIDEACDSIDRKGKKGERLFTGEAERTPYLSRMLDFVNAYQAEHQRTGAFGKLIAGLGLLEPHEARATVPGGETKTLAGFHVVSREKLKALPADKLAELVANDALELIYLHLQSIGNFEKLVHRLPENLAASAGSYQIQ
ncbi:MAG: SapC family protein [bacterium]